MRLRAALCAMAIGSGVLFATVPAGAQDFQGVAPGFDLFKTESSRTQFDPDGPGPLPMVRFQGVPLGTHDFGEPGLLPVGPTDTIVRRKTAALPEPGADTVPIELVALQLQSVDPPVFFVTLQSDRGRNPLDPPPGQHSVGSMTIHFDFRQGGTFSSQLNVNFDLRLGSINGPILNQGVLIPSSDQIGNQATPWGRDPRVQRQFDEAGLLARHGIIGPSAHLPGINVLLDGFSLSQDFHAGVPVG